MESGRNLFGATEQEVLLKLKDQVLASAFGATEFPTSFLLFQISIIR